MEKVKWFNNDENYGFIAYKDNGNVLVSYSINENEYVEFELVKTENGYEIKYIVLPKEVT